MKKIIIITIFFFFIHLDFLSAINMGPIIAYPIPFNPRSGSKLLTIDNGSGGPGGGPYTIDIEILDINGDKVFSRTYTSFPVQWNGHNKKGKRVSPGFYIVKAEVEDASNGSHGSKVFRILVRY